ncbi:MAG: radical SAM protein [Bacteroidota bacterium]
MPVEETKHESAPLEALLGRAWDLRRSAFGGGIEWVNPVRTAVLSVTGNTCALGCAHCGGHYLKHMLPIERWRELVSAKDGADRVSSYLVSGGCDERGRVPVAAHIGTVRELASRWRLNLHLGLADECEVAELAPLRPVVSFDLVADDATIREVYGLDASAEDFISTYAMLRRHVRVVPHICIGLRGGGPSGEFEALRALERLGAEALIFIVFTPTPGTRYASRTPPDPREAARIIARARVMLPTTPIYLGCMRPRGAYRDILDTLAIRAGVNRIVVPSPRAREAAEALGLSATWREECCAF